MITVKQLKVLLEEQDEDAIVTVEGKSGKQRPLHTIDTDSYVAGKGEDDVYGSLVFIAHD